MATKKKTRGKPLGIRKASVGIPSRLVAIRMLKGWSQAEAAERIGISAPSLRALETGQKLGMLEELLVHVADVYGSSLDYIYGRSDSAVERFANASPDIQGMQMNGIMTALARLTQSPETLRFVDELVTMAANELPDWQSLQSFRDSPAPQRMSMLQQLALTVARLARDRDAIKYLSAIILQYAQISGAEPATPKYTYSVERDEQTLSHNLTAIERVFGRTDPNKMPQLTPSRFKVAEAPVAKKKAKRKKTSKARSVKIPAKKK